MEQKDHQQASDKIAPHYALAVPSTFLIRILSRLPRAIGHRKSCWSTIKASEDWRAQAFLLERRWPNEYDFERVTFWARRQIWHSLRLIDFVLLARCIAKFHARSFSFFFS